MTGLTLPITRLFRVATPVSILLSPISVALRL